MKKKPPKIGNPQKVTENAYNCIDTGGFFGDAANLLI